MKFLQFFLTITVFFTFSAMSQDTIRYAHCNCYDVIDTYTPVPNGNYTRICDDVVIEKGTFKSGLKTGEWLSYSTNGELIKKITYQDGTLNGDVSYFYNSGKMKLNGSFSNGLKKGDWKFYNQKEKVQWSQSFKNGIPFGKSFVYDRKGKKVVQSYDFDKKAYDVNNEEFSIFEESSEILQDPTSSEWFILMMPDVTAKTAEMGLDQNNIESELFLSLIEIPREMFNTYLNLNYNVVLTFENFGLKSIDLNRESAMGEEYPLFAFVAMTNDPEKLNTIDHSEFSMFLLDSKIEEALSIFTPWQIESGNFNMAFLYVINKIEGREELDRY